MIKLLCLLENIYFRVSSKKKNLNDNRCYADMILYSCETELSPLCKSMTLASATGSEVSRSGCQGGKTDMKIWVARQTGSLKGELESSKLIGTDVFP